MPMTQNFPKNTEMEVELTFVRQPGAGGGGAAARRRRWRFEGVADVAATPEAASIRMHHSIVELPDAQLQAARLRSAFRATAACRTRTTPRRSARR